MEKRRGNLILKEILSAHSNGCVVWWMVSRLNNQTGFGIKSGGSRAAVCFCLQGIHRFMQSVVSTAGPLHCNQSAHSWVWFSPSSQYLSGVNLTVCVCVCIHETPRQRERECVSECKIPHSLKDNGFPSSQCGRWAQWDHSHLFS